MRSFRLVRTISRNSHLNAHNTLRQHTSVRLIGSSWNPFKKKSPVLEGPSPAPADHTVLSIRQRIRTESQPSQLKEMLLLLQDRATPGQHSFALMNEVIKKLDASAQRDRQTDVIPGLSTSESFDLFEHVVNAITPDNYQSARFVPRLYLQLTRSALKEGNSSLLLSTLGLFIRYLNALGYEDQLVKVLHQFRSEFPSEIVSRSSDVVIDFIETTQTPLHPSLLLKFLDMYPDNTRMVLSITRSASQFLDTMIREIFSIDVSDSDAIKEILSRTTQFPVTDGTIIPYLLNMCEKTSDIPAEVEYGALRSVAGFDGEISESNALTIMRRLLEQSHGDVILDLEYWRSRLEKHTLDQKLLLALQIYEKGFTDSTRVALSSSHQTITEDLFNLYIIALINSSHDSQYPQFLSYLEDLGFETNLEVYSALMKKYIHLRDTDKLEEVFSDSMKDGIDWSKDKTLNRFFTVLAEEKGKTEPKMVFRYSRKVKVHVDYLDAEAFNALVSLMLKNRFIDDAIESFKQELPLLEDGQKYKKHNYVQLYDTLFRWFTESSGDGEDVWAVYKEFGKFFEIPYEWYFPIIQRLTGYERPDLAFEMFQDMKRLHRTTGSIPPPPPEIYIHLFKQFGRHTYIDGVETLDAIFKVDLTINSSIPLLNSIMDAYCSLKNFTKVGQMYEQILASPSGPNNETVSIMLKTQTFMSLQNVKYYWNNMDELGILPNEENYEKYIIAHCYHGQEKEALNIVQEMEDFDMKLSPGVLKTLYQWTNDEEIKLLVEEWAKEEHKKIWTEVEGEIKGALAPIYEVPASLEEQGPTQDELRLMKS